MESYLPVIWAAIMLLISPLRVDDVNPRNIALGSIGLVG